jgi:tetratricopeptide (TPR) repeat protein
LDFVVNRLRKLRFSFEAGKSKCPWSALVLFAALMSAAIAVAQVDGVTIQGRVLDVAGKPVSGVLVRLRGQIDAGGAEAETDAAGVFSFPAVQAGSYEIVAQTLKSQSDVVQVTVAAGVEQKRIDLVLGNSRDSGASSPVKAMEFADKPDFAVAGVTDWTAVGGHGSDAILRTSEALSRETLTLKGSGASETGSGESESALRAAVAEAPGSFEANHRLGAFYLRAGKYPDAVATLGAAYRIDAANRGNEFELAVALKDAGDIAQAREHVQKLMAQGGDGDLHRLAGEIDEKLGDPLAAVHEYEQAARLDQSEQNYFEWGSELLLHRAVWQAQEVFQKGTAAYPKSERMLAALGAALFAGARYDEAAQRLCDASDLNPADAEPYMLMGEVEMAAPNPLTCVEEKLARFAQQQPGNSLANYFYAMAIWKGQQQPADPKAFERVEELLTRAVTIDSKCGDGYLQLGILAFSQRDYQKAIGYYLKAVEANPQLGEAHYRLGVAYDRVGEREKAKQELQLHDEIEKAQAAQVEEQRRAVKQFLVVLNGKPAQAQP